MNKIKLFLASSNELLEDRQQFEIEVYRKAKAWFDKGIFLHLDIWEDLSARMSATGSQSEYNKFVKEADLFVLLAYSKVGMYTAEEFETAFGQFQAERKPFIFTYFKENNTQKDESLGAFQEKLSKLDHFYSSYTDSKDLWNQFNKELDRLLDTHFQKHVQHTSSPKKEKNIVKKDITNVGRIKVGDKENNNEYKRKNIIEGNIDNADEFILGDGH